MYYPVQNEGFLFNRLTDAVQGPLILTPECILTLSAEGGDQELVG